MNSKDKKDKKDRDECHEPKCYYSSYRNKCIKPNPYIEYLSWCKYNPKSCNNPKEDYKIKIDEIKKNSCQYYKENLKNRKPLANTCPKKRTPSNNNCPPSFPILKLNKYNIQCCYKDKSKEEPKVKSKSKSKEESKHKSKDKSKSKSKEEPKEKQGKGKMEKIIYKYQNKEKPKKVFK
jgi:hypothetical protein